MNKAASERASRIVEAGCIVCKVHYGIWTPATIHHCDTGMGRKKDDMKTIALCGVHHQTGGVGVALHANKARWEERFGTEEELLRLQEEENGERKSPT